MSRRCKAYKAKISRPLRKCNAHESSNGGFRNACKEIRYGGNRASDGGYRRIFHNAMPRQGDGDKPTNGCK